MGAGQAPREAHTSFVLFRPRPQHHPHPLSIETMKPEYLQALRVMKKLKPGQPGTRRAAKLHGAALVCVRYRHDDLKLYRYTTVELIVDAAPIHRHRFDIASFGVHLDPHERQLRDRLKAHGARWDPADRLWWVRGAVLRTLDLVDRIHTR
jgi:hypothetical protein